MRFFSGRWRAQGQRRFAPEHGARLCLDYDVVGPGAAAPIIGAARPSRVDRSIGIEFHVQFIGCHMICSDDDDDKVCGLSDEGKAAFQTTASHLYASCTFNITVGPGRVFEQ